MVLVDSGSTHNFIDYRIEKQLNKLIYPSANFQVSIPGNKTTPCDGKCHKVELAIKDYKLRLPMYAMAMAIRGVCIVLGAPWLETLGTVGLNLREQFLRFYENERKYKVYSINCPPPQIVSSNKMEKMVKKGVQGFFLLRYAMEGTIDERQNTNPRELEQLLGEHSDIF